MSDIITPEQPVQDVDPMVALQEKKKAAAQAMVAQTNFDPNAQTEPETTPQPEPEPEPVKQEEIPEDPIEPPKQEDDSEFSLDSHSEENLTPDPEPESALQEPKEKKSGFDLRAQLKTVSNDLKSREEELAQRDEELARLQGELNQTKTEKEKLATTAHAPESHPDFIKKYNGYTKSIDDKLTSKSQWEGLNLSTNDKVAMAAEASMISELPVQDRQKAHESLRLTFAKKLGLIDHEETDFSVDPEAEAKATNYVNTFAEISNGYKELVDLRDELKDRLENGKIEIGYQEREAAAKPIRKRVASLIEMDQSLIEDDPQSLMAVASLTLKEDEKLAKGVKTTVENYRLGRRQLSQTEIDQITDSGKDLDEHVQTMERKVEKDNEKLDGYLAACIALKPVIEKLVRADAKSKSKKKDKQDTESTIRSLTNTPVKPKPTAPITEGPTTPESLEAKKKAYAEQAFGKVVSS